MHSTLRKLAVLAAASALGEPIASAFAAGDQEAFRARQGELLKAQDPERIRIDRAPTAAPAARPVDLDALGKPAPASISVSISELAAAANAGQVKEPGIVDFWLEGHYRPYEVGEGGPDQRDGTLSVMYGGTKYMLGPDIMVGALAQVDTANELGRADALSASGWMAGPYASVRFGPGIIFDGRVAWGSGQVEGGQSERRLLKGSIRGERALGDWTVVPRVGVSYAEDVPVAGEGSDAAVGQGRIELMPQLKRRYESSSGTFIEPRASAGAFLAFDDLGQLNPALEGAADLRMKAEAGVGVGVKDGLSEQATGGVEGSGTAAEEVWSGRFQLNMPLQ